MAVYEFVAGHSAWGVECPAVFFSSRGLLQNTQLCWAEGSVSPHIPIPRVWHWTWELHVTRAQASAN